MENKKIKSRLISKKILYLVFFILIFILSGCTTLRRSVQVSSYSSGQVLGNKYYLQAADSKIKNKNLVFEVQEFEKYIDIALAQKGYVKVKNIKSADQFIVFDYDISLPQIHTYSYDEPVWDTVLRPRTRYRKIDGRYYPYTYWDRDYEIIGYRTKVRTKTLYTKNVYLNSFNKTKSKNLWQVSGSMTDTSGDLRYSFPFLVKGMSSYIGIDSGQVINITIPDDDIDVEMMRRGVVNTSTIAPAK